MSETLNCPHCDQALHLIPELHGRQITCEGCDRVLAVSSEPWALCLLAPPTVRSGPSAESRGPAVEFSVETVVGRPCPRCRNRLHLIPQLHGRQIRCRHCRTLLAVFAAPWSLSVVNTRPSREGGEGEAVLDGGEGAEGRSSESGVALDENWPRRATPWEDEEGTRLHAQPQAGSFSLSLLHVVTAATGLSLVVLVLLLTWFLSDRGGVRSPQACYLPADVTTFISISPKEMPPTADRARLSGWPCFALAGRCQTFLDHAGLKNTDVDRVVGGDSPVSAGVVARYRFEQELDRETIMSQKPFRSWQGYRQKRQTIGGVPVYTVGPFAMAFPDSQTVVTGETESLLNALPNRTGRLPENMAEMLSTVDPATSAVTIRLGPSPPLVKLFATRRDLTGRIEATIDEYRFLHPWQLDRTLYFSSPSAAKDLADGLQALLHKTLKSKQTSEQLADVLEKVQVTNKGQCVFVKLSLDREQINSQVGPWLLVLF